MAPENNGNVTAQAKPSSMSTSETSMWQQPFLTCCKFSFAEGKRESDRSRLCSEHGSGLCGATRYKPTALVVLLILNAYGLLVSAGAVFC